MEPHFAVCFEGRLARELREASVPVTLLGSARFRYPWTIGRVRRRLAAVLDQEHFHAVVAHGCWAHAVVGPTVKEKGVPLIHWAHSAASGHWLERWARRTMPALVIANSRFTAESMKSLFPDVSTKVLYCPVATPPPSDRAAVRAKVRSALGTPLDATVVVVASRLEAWKGHRLLLEALSQLREEHGWICWIVGGPQRPAEARYRDDLGDQATAAGISDRVRFLGQRDDVPELLLAADIHCQPNETPEPFGIGFVEALSAGLPVVTTALGAAVEIVDESCGILVSPGRAELADALRHLLRDPSRRERLGRNGRARARALCEPEARIKELHKTMAPLADVSGV
jgi:glycosyltransferase involved in cell wall biosynthesis